MNRQPTESEIEFLMSFSKKVKHDSLRFKKKAREIRELLELAKSDSLNETVGNK